MKVGVLVERAPGERRVALVPDSAARLVKSGIEVVVETGAGAAAGFSDAEYAAAGAAVAQSALDADVVLAVNPPPDESISQLRPGSVLIGTLRPLTNPDVVTRLSERRATAFALDRIPRITRAQAMDVLSSQASLAGYKAVLLAALHLGRVFPMFTTAAGTLRPAKVLVIGAGVAGLQAIATARRLGAVVSAFDVRSAVRDEVKSLGAKFVEIAIGESAEGSGGYAKAVSETTEQQIQAGIADVAKEMDVIITTALVPGRAAPRLVTDSALSNMKAGSVVVDLAAEAGGNCEGAEPDREVVRHGVTILGPTNLPSTVAHHASQTYSRNVCTFLDLIAKGGSLQIDFGDEIVRGACVTHEGAPREGS